ncbi:DUF4056 domain-containing protein [Photobacterium leiognathi]
MKLSDENNELIYTKQGGFIDTGHVCGRTRPHCFFLGTIIQRNSQRF